MALRHDKLVDQCLKGKIDGVQGALVEKLYENDVTNKNDENTVSYGADHPALKTAGRMNSYQISIEELMGNQNTNRDEFLDGHLTS